MPAAEFRVGSLFRAEIPPCDAVTSLGECFGYLSGPGRGGHALSRLFRRVQAALAPRGVLVFDLLGSGELGAKGSASVVAKGKGWVVAVEMEEDRERRVLTRRITTFGKVGRLYRRSDETHRLRLDRATDVLRELRNSGFRARAVPSYGAMRLPPARTAFVARKPA